MRLVRGFLFDEALRLAHLGGVIPSEELLQGGVDMLLVEHGQALQPGEDKLILGEIAVRKSA